MWARPFWTRVEVNDFVEGPLKVAEDLMARFQLRSTEEELQWGCCGSRFRW